MIDRLLSLPRATRRQRFMALLLLIVYWFNCANAWGNLDADLAIVRWIAWIAVTGAIFVTPICLLVLLGNRAPHWFLSGSLGRTLPQIYAEIQHEHDERERNSRWF